MNVDRKAIATRILKMLSLAEDNSNSHEANVARRKAKELMREHSITEAELEGIEFETAKVETPYKAAPSWYRRVTGGLTKLLGVFVVYCSGRTGEKAHFRVSGHPGDIEQFEYMLHSIVNQINKQCDQWKARHKEHDLSVTRKQTGDFRNAAAQRVARRLMKLVEEVSSEQSSGADPNDAALVLTKKEESKRKIEAAKREMKKVMTWRAGSAYRRVRDTSASIAGKKAGNKVSFGKGVSSSSDHQLES